MTTSKRMTPGELVAAAYGAAGIDLFQDGRADKPYRPGVVWADGWRQQLPGVWPFYPDEPHQHHYFGFWDRANTTLVVSCCGLEGT